MEGALDLVQLRYFRAIAKSGSLTAAARDLGVSQPTLSVALRRMEEALGTTLLLRARDGVELTTTGHALLAHAHDILAGVERAEQTVRGLETHDVGRFVLGCPDALGAYFLPGFLAAFLERYPGIELSLWNGPSQEVEGAVLERAAHFGLVTRLLPHPELVQVQLFRDATELFLLGRPPRPLEKARERLRRGPLLFAARLPQTDELLRELGGARLLPDRMLPCGSLELVKNMALGGIGVAILPRRVAWHGHGGRLGRLHPALPSVPDTIHLIYRADLHRTAAAMRLKDALVAHGRSM